MSDLIPHNSSSTTTISIGTSLSERIDFNGDTDWFNNIRLLEPIGYIPPAEAEANYLRQLAQKTETASSTQTNQPPENPGRFTV